MGVAFDHARQGTAIPGLPRGEILALLIHGDGLHVLGDGAADGTPHNPLFGGELDGLVARPGGRCLKVGRRCRQVRAQRADIDGRVGHQDK